MKCIKTLTDEDFNLKEKEFNNPKLRYAARGIITNADGKIAVLNKQKLNEYKLVGGGLKENEDPTKAFKREVLEESGCKIDIDDFLGVTKELRSQDNFQQTSYIYIGHVLEDFKKTNFTKKEIAEDSRILWLDIDDAINKIKNCETELKDFKDDDIYNNKFIVRRDYYILKYYKKHCHN